MNLQDIKIKLNEVFRDVFEKDTLEIYESMTAKDLEEWDSLTHINLIVAVEKAFKLSFTTKEINGLKNVGEMIQLIADKEQKKG